MSVINTSSLSRNHQPILLRSINRHTTDQCFFIHCIIPTFNFLPHYEQGHKGYVFETSKGEAGGKESRFLDNPSSPSDISLSGKLTRLEVPQPLSPEPFSRMIQFQSPPSSKTPEAGFNVPDPDNLDEVFSSRE
ncbi:hypothetical protein CDAR_4831 [Caerostris darwini]|uniref:Uncharacterized protein n=1 Tax=Caerostris darwini TaxID=1538125 RepID=A0AAV4P3W6_9ARAC|nr:hypothetical protein CDAR_4831 [Caerostris darwini]